MAGNTNTTRDLIAELGLDGQVTPRPPVDPDMARALAKVSESLEHISAVLIQLSMRGARQD